MDEKTVGNGSPAVGIIMGSDSDWKTMRAAALVLDRLEVPYEARVVSAHRTPDDLFRYAEEAEGRGLSLIIAGAGGAAHLPGMTASKTLLPVIGVPVIATPLRGLDALLSIMQMPAGIGVATMRVGDEGAEYAALFAATALACTNRRLRAALRDLRGPVRSGVALPESPDKVVLLAEDASGLEVLQYAEEYLARLSVPRVRVDGGQARVASRLQQQIANLEAEGAAVFLAASGRGIAFAAEVAKLTPLPVLGVPTVTGPVECVDEFLQPFLEMPAGVAAFALGRPGAINAALFAATITSERGTDLWKKLGGLRAEAVAKVRAMKLPPDERGPV